MSALKISLFVLAVSCSMAVINSTHIMEQHMAPNVSSVDVSKIDEVTSMGQNAELYGSAGSDDRLSDQLFGISGWIGQLSILKDVLYLIFLPGPYLVANGVPPAIAWFVQILLNTSYVIGVVQVLMKWGLSGTTV